MESRKHTSRHSWSGYEETFGWKEFGKRVCDLTEEERREYNRLRKREARTRMKEKGIHENRRAR